MGWLEAQLSSDQSWTVTDWAGSGVDVTVTVDGAIGSSIQDAKIIISSTLVGDTPAPVVAPTPLPTKAPTPSPTAAPITSSSAPTNEEPIEQNTDAPTASPSTAGKPKCIDPTHKFTVTNKKGTKTSSVKCKKVSLKKCHWRTDDGQKMYKTCPVRCESKIPDKHLK